MYRIGVDLGGTKIAAGLLDEGGKLYPCAQRPTRPELGAQAVADAIALCIEDALRLAGANFSQCSGVGVGCPGICDSEAGVVYRAHNLGWDGVPLRQLLSRKLGLPVFIGNDADCAALGEATLGAARGAESALMITLGTGIGGGMIIGGKIYAGHRSLGGELGHVCICLDGEECTCGRRGCWEAYASATALVRQAYRAAADPASELGRLGELDGLKIFSAAGRGDTAARRVTEKYCEYVAIGLTGAINALYPEVVVLGGGISLQGERLLGPVRDYVRSHFFVGRPELAPEIKAAELGAGAGIAGAALLCRRDDVRAEKASGKN